MSKYALPRKGNHKCIRTHGHLGQIDFRQLICCKALQETHGTVEEAWPKAFEDCPACFFNGPAKALIVKQPQTCYRIPG